MKVKGSTMFHLGKQMINLEMFLLRNDNFIIISEFRDGQT